MKLFQSFFTLVLLIRFCEADPKDDLKKANISAVFPDDDEYIPDSKAYNRRFTVKPAAVTFPISAEQVSTVVTVGAKYNLSVVARSGGHNYIANGLGGKDGAVVVDLSNMTDIRVFPDGTATIQTGNRLGNVALKLNDSKRALPHGTCPYVGIGGHSAYGGFGFTSRMWGLNLDTVKSMQVVMANGTIANISANNESNLFWAMRGAAPSFGIATALNVTTFEVPASTTIFEYTWRLNPTDAAKAISDFQVFAKTDIPAEFGPEFVVRKGRFENEVTLKLFGGWYGAPEEFNGVIARYLRDQTVPYNANVTVDSYIESVVYFGDKGTADTSKPDTPDTFYAKSLMTPEASPINNKSLNAFMEYLAHEGFKTDIHWFVGIELFGGNNSAINKKPLNSTAFAHRSSLWTFQIYGSAGNSTTFPAHGYGFINNIAERITKNGPPDIGAFPNYIDDRLDSWQKLYYGAHYDNLTKYKQEYDKNKVFSFPLSIGS